MAIKVLPISPNYLLNSYLLIISPPPVLCETIMQLKKNFAAAYKAPEAVYSKPHLTLVSFKQTNAAEHRIINRLHTIAIQQAPIKIELQNFGSFPTHTIYVNVPTKTPIQDLVKQVRSQLQAALKPDAEHKPHFILEAHITLAKKLQHWQYEQAWLEYSNTPFSGRFVANSMFLLKKSPGEKYWELVRKFAFLNEPVIAQQTQLF